MPTKQLLYYVTALAIALSTLIGTAQANEPAPVSRPYQDQKALYHNNGRGQDSPAYFKSLLKNIQNHIEAVGQGHIDIKVVNHGNGVTLFQLAETDKTFADKIDELRSKGVQFLICKNTLAERNLDWKHLYGVKETDLVPSGVAELIRLQQRSYLYIHP